MKLVNTEKKEHSTVELSIAVSPETFEKSVERAYKKKVGTINLPGFRKGKAPRKMIESMYGKEVFFEEAMNICYPEAFSFAVKEAGLEPVGYPNLTDFNIDDAGEFTFKAVVAVKPEAELAAYKGLKAEKNAPVITDEDVDREVARMAERNARLVEVERPLANGDVAEFDFDGYVDGVAFDGGKAEHYSLKIGSGMFIPGFEEQMVGKTIGEAFDVNVTFPEEYQEQSLAGKPAVFKCKLHGIKESQQPVLDDEFAKDVSEFDTLDALKADLKAKLTENAEKRAEAAFEEAVMDVLVEGMKADIPEAMFEEQLDRVIEDFGYRLQMQGMNIDAYVKMTGQSPEDFRLQFRPQAERQVKVRLALETVAKLEGFEVADADVDAEFNRLAEQYKMPVERVREVIPAASLATDLKVQKAVDLIRETAEAVAPKAE